MTQTHVSSSVLLLVNSNLLAVSKNVLYQDRSLLVVRFDVKKVLIHPLPTAGKLVVRRSTAQMAQVILHPLTQINALTFVLLLVNSNLLAV